MWDYDGKKETNVSSVKGTFKMMKDVIRRSDPDSFLGMIEIPLDTIPL